MAATAILADVSGTGGPARESRRFRKDSAQPDLERVLHFPDRDKFAQRHTNLNLADARARSGSAAPSEYASRALTFRPNDAVTRADLA